MPHGEPQAWRARRPTRASCPLYPQVSYHLGSAARDRAGILGLEPAGRPCRASL